MDNDDTTIIMCTPAAWNMAHSVPGTVQREADCGHIVWAAPSSVAMLDTVENSTLRCIPCALATEGITKANVEMHPQQRQELNKTLGVSATDQIATALQRSNTNRDD